VTGQRWTGGAGLTLAVTRGYPCRALPDFGPREEPGMTKMWTRLAALTALTLALSLGATGIALADGVKVAVVDLQKVLHTTNAGKAAQKKFDDLRDRKKAQLEKQDKSLQKRQKDLMQGQQELERAAAELQQKGQAPGDDLKKKYADLQDQAKKFQQDALEFEKANRTAQEELARREGELLKPIEDVIKVKVEAIAKEQGIALVVNKGVAIYVAAEVIKRCDAQ
jgi:outer membrane protein